MTTPSTRAKRLLGKLVTDRKIKTWTFDHRAGSHSQNIFIVTIPNGEELDLTTDQVQGFYVGVQTASDPEWRPFRG